MTRLTLAQRAAVLDRVADNLRNDVTVAHLAGEKQMEAALRQVLRVALSEQVYVATVQDMQVVYEAALAMAEARV